MNKQEAPAKHRKHERSFSLLETMVAVSLVAMLMVEVSGVHGNAIGFNQYSRKILQASYLAKRLMAQVEYNASIRTPIKDFAGVKEKDKPFEDDPEFTYSISIEPIPRALDLMFKIISGGLVGEGDKQESDNTAGAILEQAKGLITQSVGEEPLWVAKVEVNWPEGVRQGSMKLAMIVADIKKIEDSVGALLDAAQGPPAASTDSNTSTRGTPTSNPSTTSPAGTGTGTGTGP
jgi:type II secretory pathway pseudopilin PulG